MIDWNHIDTVLLDMDGTLLDLSYDNHIWNERVPERYASHREVPLEESRDVLFTHMREVYGRLEFYCMDYWAERTGLDIVDLHVTASHLVRYRADAEAFLRWLGHPEEGRDALIVTNAHPAGVIVKHARTGLLDQVDGWVSCHFYGSPKEDRRFWQLLMAERPFDPARTLLIDDNVEVLRAADAFGIAHLVTIGTPDSGKPAREALPYPTINQFDELMPSQPAETDR